MSRIDAITKSYLSKNEIFADAFNFYLYGGKSVIKPQKLHELDTASITLPYSEDGKVASVQKYRDVLKSFDGSVVGMEDGDAAYLIMGIESQANIHLAMPVRNMLYDALQYSGQVKSRGRANRKNRQKREEFLSNFRKDDKLIPVITLVIYFGSDKWDGPLSIHEMLSDDFIELRQYMADYRINIIVPSDVEDDEFDKFKSHLGSALLCVKHMSDDDFSILGDKRFESLDLDSAMLIREITNMDIEPKDYIDEGGRVNMCRAWENTKRISHEEGKVEGELIGTDKTMNLMRLLFEAGRLEDAKKAANDREYCNLLIKELGLN